ncbi:MAG: hypothetical protein IPJ27_00100 [Candidatus Accumulibacter sp.]|uniref:SD-repeat containing protein B domain-containing protein n=1 Tax=Candidatus Accumulibacter proximus TaxID=2954385 RepID=A0A935PWI3_9PROT|nr:hypothetical protein [Candidatus Accumulibacter proximus]
MQFSAPAGTVFTGQNVGANGFDTVDSDADVTTGKTQIVTLAQGEHNPTLDAGVYAPAKLSGYVYKDVGNDGVRNSEPAIAGVVLTLTGTNGLGQPVTATATTDANGFYQFINLAPGTYTVSGAAGGLHRRQGHRGQHGRQQRGQRRAQRHHAGPGANSVENNFGEIVTASLGDRPGPTPTATASRRPVRSASSAPLSR